MSDVILPGATLGVLGSGQLGRMFAIAARRLGYQVLVYSPDANTPAGKVADVEYTASYDDYQQLAKFAEAADVVTFEFENVPSTVTDIIGTHSKVRPSGRVLGVSQHRITEKSTLRNAGLPVPAFEAVRSAEDLEVASRKIGLPAVLKTASSGYDGKGQMIVQPHMNLTDAWQSLRTHEAILEEFVDFECELSVVGARNTHGEFVYYGPFRNMHANHILDVTVCPSGLGEKIDTEAAEIARTVFETLDVIGVLCVEFFLTRSGKILINEIAPRPHNSGHLTIDAHLTCQFEQQVRAICGLPLGSVHQHQPAAMANLLGDLWAPQQPSWVKLLSNNDVKLHLYGKHEARPGRKMGHITALHSDTKSAEALVRAARASLTQ